MCKQGRTLDKTRCVFKTEYIVYNITMLTENLYFILWYPQTMIDCHKTESFQFNVSESDILMKVFKSKWSLVNNLVHF